nr:uncharacterized protein LOC117690163 isoform X2 [Crassostrea gigas]
MAAPIEVCRICNCDLPKKHRRVIFSESFCVFNQLTQVIDYNASPNDGMSKYVCGYCFTKLNKLHKIDMELLHKMDALRREKGEVLGSLRDKHAKALLLNIARTPKSKDKRSIVHSPTPRKTKKTLFTTPRKEHIEPEGQAMQEDNQRLVLATPMETMKPITIKSFTPSKIKVVYKTKKTKNIRTKLVKDCQLGELVRSIAIHNAPKRTIRAMYNTPLKDVINNHIMTELKQEIGKLTSSVNRSLLRQIDSKSLATFSIDRVNEEIQIWAPLFHQCMLTLSNNNLMGATVAACVMLKYNNKHMSALQHIIGQILDHGGATDDTIDTLSKMGMCVTASSSAKRKHHLLSRQQQHIKRLLTEPVKEDEQITGTHQLIHL